MKKAAEAVTASAPGAEGLWKRPAPRPLASSASSSLTRSGAGEVVVAFACFLVLCAAVLSHPTKLVEQDAYAYRASIVALSEGHVTLSTNQYEELRRRLVASDGGYGIGIGQWVHLADGRWVSEKNPGYPFFAVPFQLIGALRLAPLFYAALACAGLFFGGRRWLGRWGGAVGGRAVLLVRGRPARSPGARPCRRSPRARCWPPGRGRSCGPSWPAMPARAPGRSSASSGSSRSRELCSCATPMSSCWPVASPAFWRPGGWPRCSLPRQGACSGGSGRWCSSASFVLALRPLRVRATRSRPATAPASSPSASGR